MNKYRNDFPMLKQKYIYFNSASTTYKPKVVIDQITEYYEKYSVNTNRGVDSLSYGVTNKFEEVRKVVAKFINSNDNEIIFTRGTTDGLNIASRLLENQISENDEIIVSIHEHHANFIPWQELCKRKKAHLIIVNTKDDGTVDLTDLASKLNDRTKIVALNHVSNVFGGSNNLKEISKLVHNYKAYFVVDGAQGITHERIDVKNNDVDFYAFSSHKIYGPMGVGVLYSKYHILESMYPITFGGEMIDVVTVSKATYKKPPHCFEAGTMMIPEVLGLGAALSYVDEIGYDFINNHIKSLRRYLIDRLVNEIDNIEIYNKDIENSYLITFNIKNIHAHDVTSYLDSNDIIVRGGHHCASPLMEYLNIPSSVRISFALYNTKEECDILVAALKKVEDYIDVLFK